MSSMTACMHHMIPAQFSQDVSAQRLCCQHAGYKTFSSAIEHALYHIFSTVIHLQVHLIMKIQHETSYVHR